VAGLYLVRLCLKSLWLPWLCRPSIRFSDDVFERVAAPFNVLTGRNGSKRASARAGEPRAPERRFFALVNVVGMLAYAFKGIASSPR